MTSKKQYKEDKKIRELYRSMQNKPGETYSEYKKRVKRDLGW